MEARVGDWFVFQVADGRFAAARIGAVARRGKSYTGWFFGPFDAPPAVSSLHELTPADAVWPAHFYSLEGAGGPWERVIEGGPDAEVWGVAHFGGGSEKGPWTREIYHPEDPSTRIDWEYVDHETFDALPTRDGVTSGVWLERDLPYVFDDPVRYRRIRLAHNASSERYMRRAAPVSPPPGPAHTRFFLYFENATVTEEAARRIHDLGLRAEVRPSADQTLVLAAGDVDDFEDMRERLEALAEELGGEYDGHERAVT